MKPFRSTTLMTLRIGMLLLICAPGLGAAQSLDDLFPDPVVARGKGVLVKRGELERAFIAYQSNLAVRGQRISEIERTLREAQMLDRLIVTQLLVNRTTDADREKAKELAAENLALSKETSASDAVFALRLKALGLTEAQYNLQLMEFSLAQAVIERELGPQVTITEQEIDDFYQTGSDAIVRNLTSQLGVLAAAPDSTGDQLKAVKDRIEAIRRTNLAWFNTLEQRRIHHLLLVTVDKTTQSPLPEKEIAAKRRQIEQLLTIARKGEDFAKLIALYSEEDGVDESHGEATVIRKGRLPQLEAATFSLVPNQISDVVETVLGFHIIKLDEIIPAQRKPKEEAAPKIRELLFEQKLQALMPPYLSKLKQQAGIEILEERYQAVLLDDSNPLSPPDLLAPQAAEKTGIRDQ